MNVLAGGLEGLVCDLDGVLYRGTEPVPGVAGAIEEIRHRGIKVVFATNNATRTPAQYVERLTRFEVHATEEDIVTSAVVTAEELERRGWAGRTVFLIGSHGIRRALQAIGMKLLEGVEARAAEIVVVAGTATFDYDLMATAAFAVRGGAEFIATNEDPTFPAADGLWPGAGAILAGVERASGRRAEVMGKPNRQMMEAISRRLDPRRKIAVVGDQPATDLDGGRAMGWSTILVLSGVTDARGAAQLRPAPDLIVPSLVELVDQL